MSQPKGKRKSRPGTPERDALGPITVQVLEENISLADSRRIDEAIARTPIKRVRRDTVFIMPPLAEKCLEKLDCPRLEIDACASRADVDALFDKYVYCASDAQRQFLEDTGFDPDEFNSRDVASALIRKIKTRLPATENQMRELARIYRRDNITGDTPVELTELSASALITDLNALRPPTAGQLEALRRRGVSDAKLPDLFVDATAMLATFQPRKKSNTDAAIEQAVRKATLASTLFR